VPLPIGDGQKFSCNASAFPFPSFKATICNSIWFVTTYKGLTPGPYSTVDAAKALGG
jgi:branched-chain amino acid transport system substrate-binding protein